MRPTTHRNNMYKFKSQKDKHSRDGRKHRKPGKGGKIRYAKLHYHNSMVGWRDDVVKEHERQQ